MREKPQHRLFAQSRSIALPVLAIVLCGAIIYALGGWLWWSQIYQNPDRVYWGMMANSLQTTSVTRRLTQNSTASKLDQTVVQTFDGTGNGQQAVQAFTSLQQGESVIKTQNIGTLTKDYIEYTSISSDQKSAAGKPLNFASTLNKWAMTNAPNVAAAQNPALFSQVALGLAGGNLVPQANLAPAKRDKLLALLHDTVVFDTNTNNVKKQRVNGRPQYVYTSNVQAVGYVGYQKEFAKMLGLKLLDKVDPNEYQGQAATKVELTVDVWSHQLVSVSYAGQDRKEQYSSYGSTHEIALPNATLSGEQLQQLINKVD